MNLTDAFPVRLEGAGGWGGATTGCPPELGDALAADPEALLGNSEVVKRSRRTLVACVDARWALKRYLSGGLRRRLGFGRARRAAARLVQLRAAGVPAVEPVAWLEGPAGGFVVTPWLHASTGADRFLADAVPAARRAATRALADCIGRLHAGGFLHRDLKAANLMLDDAAAVVLVDVEGARRGRLAGPERRLRDLQRLRRSLAALPVRRTDCRRFCAAYAGAAGREAGDARAVMRALAGGGAA